MLSIIVNGKPLELFPNTSINIEGECPLVAEETNQNAWAFPIEVPASPHNCLALGFPNVLSVVVDTILDVVVQADDGILTNEKLRINSASSTRIKIALLLSNPAKELLTERICDINLAPYVVPGTDFSDVDDYIEAANTRASDVPFVFGRFFLTNEDWVQKVGNVPHNDFIDDGSGNYSMASYYAPNWLVGELFRLQCQAKGMTLSVLTKELDDLVMVLPFCIFNYSTYPSAQEFSPRQLLPTISWATLWSSLRQMLGIYIYIVGRNVYIGNKRTQTTLPATAALRNHAQGDYLRTFTTSTNDNSYIFSFERESWRDSCKSIGLRILLNNFAYVLSTTKASPFNTGTFQIYADKNVADFPTALGDYGDYIYGIDTGLWYTFDAAQPVGDKWQPLTLEPTGRVATYADLPVADSVGTVTGRPPLGTSYWVEEDGGYLVTYMAIIQTGIFAVKYIWVLTRSFDNDKYVVGTAPFKTVTLPVVPTLSAELPLVTGATPTTEYMRIPVLDAPHYFDIRPVDVLRQENIPCGIAWIENPGDVSLRLTSDYLEPVYLHSGPIVAEPRPMRWEGEFGLWNTSIKPLNAVINNRDELEVTVLLPIDVFISLDLQLPFTYEHNKYVVKKYTYSITSDGSRKARFSLLKIT